MEMREWIIDVPDCSNLVSEDALATLVCSILEDDCGKLHDLYFMADNKLDDYSGDFTHLKAAVTDLLTMSGILDYVNGLDDPVVDCVVKRRTMAITVYG